MTFAQHFTAESQRREEIAEQIRLNFSALTLRLRASACLCRSGYAQVGGEPFNLIYIFRQI
jgi:hypothetical protein